MKLITNADDLGLSQKVNEAIFGLMSESLVTSATMLANGERVEDAASRLKEFPQCSFGAHLNLTEFRPVGGGKGLSPLLDSSGQFNGRVRQIGAALFLLQRPIFEEWCAQIELLKNAGVPISHIDGHHHVHTIPTLFPVLKAVQRRYGIRRVRISLNVYSQAEAAGRRLPMVQKQIYNFGLRWLYRTRTTDAFMSLNAYCENRAQIAARYSSGEIMLHPGGPDSDEEIHFLREQGRTIPDFKSSLVSYHSV
jgi:hypothetical protein